MEARLAHHQPLAVTQHAPGIDEAFRGAADKLKRLLDSKLGRAGRSPRARLDPQQRQRAEAEPDEPAD